MLSIKEKNQEILSNYNGMTSIIIASLIDIEKDNINSISFEPFENIEVKRYHNEYEAFQKVETEKGFDFYIEPATPYPGNRIIFVKDIPEKNIKKGDEGLIYGIKSINSKRNEFQIDLNDNRNIRVDSSSCVLDTNYKFLYFAKVPVAGQKQLSNLHNWDYLKDESHFADSDNSIICAMRIKGNLNKESLTLARESFYEKYPGAKKQEEEGKYSYLILNSFPTSSKSKELVNDYFKLHKITYDISTKIKNNLKHKM
jgi:hypothetical protein